MRRFIASWTFSFLLVCILAGATTVAYILLEPTGSGIFNAEILHAGKIAGYAVGPIMGIITILLIGIVRLIRRIVHAHNVQILAPIIALISIIPWLIFSWQLTAEPRYTPIAEMIIDFIARPMLWGSLSAMAIVCLSFLPFFIPRNK